MTRQEILFPSTARFLPFYDVSVALDIVLRARVLGDGLRRQTPSSFTVTQFWFLLVNHLIILSVYMTVSNMT